MQAQSFALQLCRAFPLEWVERMQRGKTRGTHAVYRSIDADADPASLHLVRIFHPPMWCEVSYDVAGIPLVQRGVLCSLSVGHGSPVGVFDPYHRSCCVVRDPSKLRPREEECTQAKATFLSFMYANERNLYAHVYEGLYEDPISLKIVGKHLDQAHQAWALHASVLAVDWSTYEVTREDWDTCILHTALHQCVYRGERRDRMGMIWMQATGQWLCSASA